MEEEALFVNEEMVVEDDPVVSEIPVYLNNFAGDSLVLLQYPTRHSSQPFKASQVKLKPNSQAIETDLEADVPAQYIDSSNGSTLQGLTQTYGGILKENSGRFAVGYVHNNALNLSLIPRTGQLRPKFASKTPTILQPSMLQANSQTKAQDQQPSLRSVQMSVKSTSAEIPKHSGVLEFWRQANKEEAVEYEPQNIDETQQKEILAGEHDEEPVLLETSDSKMTFL